MWTEALHVNGAVITFKLDTGARANLVNKWDINAMNVKPYIMSDQTPLKAYNGLSINTKGKCKLKVSDKGKVHSLMFVVVPERHESLLGDKACERFGPKKSIPCQQECLKQCGINSETISRRL